MKNKPKTIFDFKIKQFMDDYKFKKNKALRFFHLSEACTDPDGKATLQDKAEKWIKKAEEVLQKIEQTKLSERMVLKKKNELNNTLETNKPENIL